ncbi:hypothetical protein SP19_177 [Salmonella phage 19]|nr:hypothetical protein SP19_177 [Salmonella phage 19]
MVYPCLLLTSHFQGNSATSNNPDEVFWIREYWILHRCQSAFW